MSKTYYLHQSCTSLNKETQQQQQLIQEEATAQ